MARKYHAVHYSQKSNLTELWLDKFGSAHATRNDLRGLPKIFFFQKGSQLGGDQFLARLTRYHADLTGFKIYNSNGRDPLKWYRLNREAADQAVIDAGYDGVRGTRYDGARWIILFKKKVEVFKA